jgi:uncharacterized protein YhaN
LYLGDMNGFLILDDPSTDMDRVRRRATAYCLAELANRRQLLFFTCYLDHSCDLHQVSGAKIPAIIG